MYFHRLVFTALTMNKVICSSCYSFLINSDAAVSYEIVMLGTRQIVFFLSKVLFCGHGTLYGSPGGSLNFLLSMFHLFNFTFRLSIFAFRLFILVFELFIFTFRLFILVFQLFIFTFRLFIFAFQLFIFTFRLNIFTFQIFI